jgi:GNAT superfamily N-acetyltransferase
MKLFLSIAQRRADVLRCQALIAQIYNHAYEVVFSDDHYDLAAKIEPWPHRYLMGELDGELVCAAGLYLHSTYVQRFGLVSDDELRALRVGAGCEPDTSSTAREISKMVVHPQHRGKGLARAVLMGAHARDFLHPGEAAPNLLLCSKRSLVRSCHNRIGVHPRTIKPFPIYKVHELYASPADPMDSYLTLPELDIPPELYLRKIPGEYAVEQHGDER